MSKHTPGPWYVKPPTAQSPSTAAVTACCGFVRIYEAPLTVETAANARLIGAAPELLEALKAVVRVADRNTDEFNAARIAIANAEGGGA